MKIELSVSSGVSNIWVTAETVEEAAELLALHTNVLKAKPEFMLSFGDKKVVECITLSCRVDPGTYVER